MKKKVSIQGYEGSFHQLAAQQFFGSDTEVLPCATFRDVVKVAADKRKSDGGVMAIENSIAGSILPNYGLLHNSPLKIVGEIYLEIRQNLLVNPGVKLTDIKEIHSHPVAIQQCYEFLDPYNWKLVETEDTALSAKHIHQNHSKHIAAIAGVKAAELFNLDILAPDIHTMKNNYTRFLIIQPVETPSEIESPDKASVNFLTDHSRGILSKVLARIADEGVNLSKLQSMPIPGSDWQYSFYADLEFERREQFNKVMEMIKPVTKEITIYGVYKNGKQPSQIQNSKSVVYDRSVKEA